MRRFLLAVLVLVSSLSFLGWAHTTAPAAAAWDVEVDRPDFFNAMNAFPCYFPSVAPYDLIDCSFTIEIPYGGHVLGSWQCDGEVVAATQHYRNYTGPTTRVIVAAVDTAPPTINVGPDAMMPWGEAGHARTCAYSLVAIPPDGSMTNLYPPQPFGVYDIKMWAVFGIEGSEDPYPEPTPSPSPTPGASPTPTPTLPDYTVQCGYSTPTTQSCSSTNVRYVRDGPTVAPDQLKAGEHFRITLEVTEPGTGLWSAVTGIKTFLPADGVGREQVTACNVVFSSGSSAPYPETECAADFVTPRTSRAVVGSSFLGITKPGNAQHPVSHYIIARWYRTGVDGPDTDGDGWSDQWEVDHGTDPNDPTDYPGHPAPSATPTPTPATTPTPREPGVTNPDPRDGGFDVCSTEYSASTKLLCSDDELFNGPALCTAETANLAICAEQPTYSFGEADPDGDAVAQLLDKARNKAPFAYAIQAADALGDAVGGAAGGGGGGDWCFDAVRWVPGGTATEEACLPIEDMADQAAGVRPVLLALVTLGFVAGVFMYVMGRSGG